MDYEDFLRIDGSFNGCRNYMIFMMESPLYFP